MTKISPWIEEARASLRESALNRIDFNALPEKLYQGIMASFMHLGLYAKAQEQGFMKMLKREIIEVPNFINHEQQEIIKQMVIDFLVKNLR